ncbi:uncharacterized protein LAESUDRAFT_647835 [Laetiporus sulphureus 93-53]|uniref:Protein ZIP4 homolog n=1 Tax=Laetiporus sulphureus 93-53 TaxID=1314785 RepID=A0A165FJE0_9APHY|nr:uncharacterized protein LAESUDRAFT_647835 [Laetiporus sulphureus 93-53]KZT09061.1 hypothetical protein LAESUDRAFT_647835 [Laetiporus sulphureus 93-53]
MGHSDILNALKPELKRNPLARSTCAELHRLASLAEPLVRQRPRPTEDWIRIANTLDSEGVSLWNTSASARDDDTEDGRATIAALRLAGFRLIEAGLEPKPGVESNYTNYSRGNKVFITTVTALMHILQLASKAGVSLAGSGNHDTAAHVLACAAQYEEALKKAEDPEEQHASSRARAIVVYYSSRMEAASTRSSGNAWREDNNTVAEFMLQKIIGKRYPAALLRLMRPRLENEYLALLLPQDRGSLASKLLEIGKALLRAGSRVTDVTLRGRRAGDAVKWLQKAFTVLEYLDEASSPGKGDLKKSILRSLSRAYFLSSSEDEENLVRAETTLNELASSMDMTELTSNEHQQLQWMKIAILKKRKAPQPVLLEAFQSIVNHMKLTEGNVTDVLQELRSLNQEHVLVTAVHQRCLQRCIEAEDNPLASGHVDRLILSLIFHCSKDIDHSRAMKDLDAAFANLANAEFELSRTSATACLTLLWQFGDRLYQAKRWPAAADWFLAGTHQLFAAVSKLSDSRCLRKAALCYVQQGNFAQAAAVIRRAASDEAATHYVKLLVAVHEGAKPIRAVKAMVTASDFNHKMLMLATRLANESDMKTLLLSVLEELLETVKAGDNPDITPEAITLVRCIIRLLVKLLGEPGCHQTQLVPVLVRHFKTAQALVQNLDPRTNAALISRDISWLWRTAYNIAVQGCAEWEDSLECVSDLFDIARQLLECYNDSALTDVDVEIPIHIMEASFAAIAGRGLAEPMQALSEDIAVSKKRIRAVIDSTKLLDAEDITRVESFIQVLHVFEAEILCKLKDWERLLPTIKDAMQSEVLAADYFEAITDILWAEQDCPVHVLLTALEAILHTSLDRSSLSIDKFARWLRAICMMLLSRNTAADRAKAIGYVEQAVHVLENHGTETDSEAYPMDERHWLLGTAYNTGIECLHASSLDEAKRWFEASSTVCRFIPNGNERAEKVETLPSASPHIITKDALDIGNLLTAAGALYNPLRRSARLNLVASPSFCLTQRLCSSFID